jgi:enoyl-CoA hydratase/carnithine racemase
MPTLLLPIITGAANLLRLPALASFLGTLFAQLVSFFAQWFTVKTAMQLGIVTAVVSLTVALFASIKILIAGIAVVAPPEFVQAMSLIIPDNLPLCFTSIVSARVVRWVWIWQVHFIELYAGMR